MAALPGLGAVLENLIHVFTATQKWSSFGAAPQAGLPGGNVISGRPEVATNARALTRILSGQGASGAGIPMPKPTAPQESGAPPPQTTASPLKAPSQTAWALMAAERAHDRSGKGWTQMIAPAPLPGTKGSAGGAPPLPGGAGVAGSGATPALMLTKGEELASMFGTIAGKAVPLIGFASAAVSAAEGLKNFAESVTESNRSLGKWNGQLAIAQAKEDIAAVQREAHMAQATGGTGTMAQEQVTFMENELQPIKEDLKNIANIAAAMAANTVGVMAWLAKSTPGFSAMEWFLQQINDNTKKDTAAPLAELFDFLKTRGQNIRNPSAVHGARNMRPRGGANGDMGPAGHAHAQPVPPPAQHPAAQFGGGRRVASHQAVNLGGDTQMNAEGLPAL